MKYQLLSRGDLDAIDALKEHHGGAQRISDLLRERRRLETRKRVLEEKGFGEMIADAASRFIADVHTGAFPSEAETYQVPSPVRGPARRRPARGHEH